MAFGGGLGYVFGKGAVLLINRLRLDYGGLYSVLTLTLVPLIYGVTSLAEANGFLAVYVAGVVKGNSSFAGSRSYDRPCCPSQRFTTLEGE